MIRLLLGGSPCTYWSIAQTKNRETEPSGMGWDLFKNYVITIEKFKPDFFLYENNYSMSKAIKEQINKEFGFEPIMIDSKKLSAQTRKRLYWVGRRNKGGSYSKIQIEQPADKGILVQDILENGCATREKAYTLKANMHNYFYNTGRYAFSSNHYPENGCAVPVRIGTIQSNTNNEHWDSRGYRVYAPNAKGDTLCGQGGGAGAKTGLYATVCAEGDKEITKPVYEVKSGYITIDEQKYPTILADGYYIIRKLTVRECMRLQTVPECYEFPVSNTQAYKMLGNGWTYDVIAHILSFCEGIKDEPLQVLSMYDGMACGHITLDKLGCKIDKYYATEIDKYAIKTAKHNFPDIIELGDAFQVRQEQWGSELW